MLVSPRFLVYFPLYLIGALSSGRKCFNLTMTVLEYNYLVKNIERAKKYKTLDDYLTIGTNVLMMVFWMYDILIILRKAGMVKVPFMSLLKPQLKVNLIVIILNMILRVRHYLSIKRQLKEAKDKEEEAEIQKKKTRALFMITKTILDFPSTIDGTQLLQEIFNYSFHELVVYGTNIGSALCSLRNLFAK